MNDIEHVGIELVSDDESLLKQVPFRFIRCSAYATITHIKKLIALRLFDSIEKQKMVCLVYKGGFKLIKLTFPFRLGWYFLQ